MNSPWHHEYYQKALREMTAFADDKICEGWLEYFKTTHPEQYQKYIDATAAILTLWGKSDSTSMEEFKKAVKVEIDATKWALSKYQDALPVKAYDGPPSELESITCTVTQMMNFEEAVECLNR